MKDLFDLFDEFGLPYFRQGSMSDAQYQPEFFTFWNIDTPSDSHYDNQEIRFHEYVQVGYYTNDASKIYSTMDEFTQRARAKGFTASRAFDAPADKDNYYGRVCYVRILQKN